MRPIWLSGMLLWYGLLLLVLPAPAHAQAFVTLDPPTVTIAAQRGAVIERRVVLRAAGVPGELSALPGQLVRADDAAALAPNALQVRPEHAGAGGSGQLTLWLRIDTAAAPAGRYHGQIVLSHDGAVPREAVLLPVTLVIKDPPALALALLFGGVALAAVLTHYRNEVQPRDQLAAHEARLRAQWAVAQPDGFAPLLQAARAALDAARLDLDVGRVTAAHESLAEAEALLAVAQRHARAWHRLAGFAADLAQHMAQAGADDAGSFARGVRRAIDEALESAAWERDPAALNERLEALAQLVALHRLAGQRCRELALLAEHQADPAQRAWMLHRAGALAERLHTLAPRREALLALDDELRALLHDREPLPLIDALSPGAAVAETASTRPVLAGGTDPAVAARRRQRWFGIAQMLVAILVLGGAGFAELYLARDDFGASWWGDYVALLMWGFSAETSRAAVSDVVRQAMGRARPSA
ncbi:MAG: hypothetical protein KGS47_15065 [Chloroflexi bacterium]|nr:hypothetical protein [Chloroflexota bacterium]